MFRFGKGSLLSELLDHMHLLQLQNNLYLSWVPWRNQLYQQLLTATGRRIDPASWRRSLILSANVLLFRGPMCPTSSLDNSSAPAMKQLWQRGRPCCRGLTHRWVMQECSLKASGRGRQLGLDTPSLQAQGKPCSHWSNFKIFLNSSLCLGPDSPEYLEEYYGEEQFELCIM